MEININWSSPEIIIIIILSLSLLFLTVFSIFIYKKRKKTIFKKSSVVDCDKDNLKNFVRGDEVSKWDWKTIKEFSDHKDKLNNGGIYAIWIKNENIKDYKPGWLLKPIYVGKTGNFRKRFMEHREDLYNTFKVLKIENNDFYFDITSGKKESKIELKYFKMATYLITQIKRENPTADLNALIGNKNNWKIIIDNNLFFNIIENWINPVGFPIKNKESVWMEKLDAHSKGFNQSNNKTSGYYVDDK